MKKNKNNNNQQPEENHGHQQQENETDSDFEWRNTENFSYDSDERPKRYLRYYARKHIRRIMREAANTGESPVRIAQKLELIVEDSNVRQEAQQIRQTQQQTMTFLNL